MVVIAEITTIPTIRVEECASLQASKSAFSSAESFIPSYLFLLFLLLGNASYLYRSIDESLYKKCYPGIAFLIAQTSWLLSFEFYKNHEFST